MEPGAGAIVARCAYINPFGTVTLKIQDGRVIQLIKTIMNDKPSISTVAVSEYNRNATSLNIVLTRKGWRPNTTYQR
jgi:hypothetical protein